MNFIYCPVCERGSSPEATACLGCGHPLALPEPPKVQTVEQTSKAWKLVILLSAVATVIGAVGMGYGFSRDWAIVEAYRAVFVVGLVVQVFARVGAWWFHG